MKLQHLLISSLLLAPLACKKPEAPTPPPAPVTFASPIEEDVVEWDEFSGHLESPQTVNVAARVSGVIIQAPFVEGATVKQGDLLFEIDPRPYQAELAAKDADVARAQAQFAQAQAHYHRYEKIKGTRAISDEDYDQALASLQSAQAQIASARAAQQTAKLNLEWTKVTAPIPGKVSKKFVTEGNLVNGGAGQATQLTVINSVDPLFCYVNVPENRFLQYQVLGKARRDAGQSSDLPCSAQLEGEKTWSHPGRIDFIDTQIDRRTGTIQIRGVLNNSSGDLASGLFARLRVLASAPYKAILVPDIAVSTDQNTKYVLLLKDDQTVEMRGIKIGKLFGKLRAVTDGLKPGDKVIINGMQLAKPGSKVNPTQSAIAEEQIAELRKTYSPTALMALVNQVGLAGSVEKKS